MLHFFAVYGNPIIHSKSPFLHNYVYTKLGISAYYGRILLSHGENLFKDFRAHNLRGANITIPFKEYAYRLCDEVRGIAYDIGACNTWVRDENKIVGYNTDAEGFHECIKDYKIKNALILGAGGSARAVAMILKKYNIAITILNRSMSRFDFFTQKGFECHVSDTFKPQDDYDMIINTTSAGLNNTDLPCSEALLNSLFAHASYAFDLVYGKQTPFLTLAGDFGLTCCDGRKMLIYQAALAFRYFCPSICKDISFLDIASLMSEALSQE